MGIIENPEKEIWNETIQNFDINIMDTYEYGEIWKKTGFDILRLAIPNRAFLQAKIAKNFGITRKIVIGGMGGDCLFYLDNEGKNQLLNTLTNHIKKTKIPECIIYSTKKQKLPGFEESYGYTIILDINKTIESLWTNLDKKHRNAIRKGEKNKIEICTAKNQKELIDFHNLLKETAKRAKFSYQKFDFFRAAWEMLVLKNMGRLFLAKYRGETIAGAFILIFKDTIYFWNGASSSEFWRLKPNNLLHWKIIEWANKNGFKKYNMWGVDPDPNSPSYGTYVFKKKFGGELVKMYLYNKVFSRRKKWVLNSLLVPFYKRFIL